MRARLDRPVSTDGDATIDVRLADSFDLGEHPRRTSMGRYLVVRTRFFDEQLVATLAAGCDQIVVVGAGYDLRAQRFRTPGVRFFELDHPSTQRDKRERLESIGASVDGVVFVSADFEADDVGEALEQAGHDAARPTFFLCEGVMIYLTESAIARLLTALAGRAAPASALAMSLPILGGSDRAEQRDGDRRAERADFEQRLDRIGEPRRTTLEPSQAHTLVARGGWTIPAPSPDRTSSRLVVASPRAV